MVTEPRVMCQQYTARDAAGLRVEPKQRAMRDELLLSCRCIQVLWPPCLPHSRITKLLLPTWRPTWRGSSSSLAAAAAGQQGASSRGDAQISLPSGGLGRTLLWAVQQGWPSSSSGGSLHTAERRTGGGGGVGQGRAKQ